ncbi:MAG: PDZ domain-containing protein [Deltaproteobacteria bacterium]
MNSLKNPLLLLAVAATALYLFVFYLADGPARRRTAEREVERQFQTAPINNPNAAANVAGIVMKEENPFNIGKDRGQWNVLNGNQFFSMQNRQNPMPMQEETPFPQQPARKNRLSRPIDPNGQAAQPVAQQYPTAASGQNLMFVAGGAMGKTWVEAHWIGLEAGPLVPAVAKANKIPLDVKGVLVDEVTLLAASSGLLAGDVITAVNNAQVTDLQSFKQATKLVAQSPKATVTIFRKGSYRDITITAAEELGLAQIEGAPMILATDRAPHGYYGPCDKCHAIAPAGTNLNQLAKDLGDILTTQTPNIRKGTPAPHAYRGVCTKCHVML